MNEKYLFKLQQDMLLKNFAPNTCQDYYRFVKKFLEFTGKDAMCLLPMQIFVNLSFL